MGHQEVIIPAPKIEPIRGESIWKPTRFRLHGNWIIILDDGLPLVFLDGFESDLASTPRFVWAIPGYSPTGVLLEGGIAHDHYYQYQYFLTFYRPELHQYYPEESLALREQFPLLFTEYIPVFVGRNQAYADNLLAKITIEAHKAKFIAESAELALKKFGTCAWSRYRSKGPSAYNSNSLGLPGITLTGVGF